MRFGTRVRSMTSSGRLWLIGLAAVLAWWGLMELGVLKFSSANEILGIGALVTAGLILLGR